jgi:tetratricopeptide (TPR) repeat protein
MRLAESLGHIGEVYYEIQDHEQGLLYFNRSLELFEAIGCRRGVAEKLECIAGSYYGLGKYEKALGYLYRALPIQREIGDTNGLTNTLNMLGINYARMQCFEQAVDYLQQSRKVAEDSGYRGMEGLAWFNIGRVYEMQGFLEIALEYIEKAVAIGAEIQSMRLSEHEAALKQLRAKIAS